jgi:hypothetical protein
MEWLYQQGQRAQKKSARRPVSEKHDAFDANACPQWAATHPCPAQRCITQQEGSRGARAVVPKVTCSALHQRSIFA